MTQKEFLIRKTDIQDVKFVEQDSPATLADNQIRVQYEQAAFTANNVSYAVTGDMLGYWKFFPTSDDEWGKLPVWGFAEVTESNHSMIDVGERLYGFFPLASEFVIDAGRVTDGGLLDVAPHRKELSGVYNRYVRVNNSDGFASEHDALNAIMRPMFTTSFMLDDFLADNDFFEGEQIILSSASSKTAYSLAFLLNHHRASRRDYKIIGLTSPRNVDFVTSLGLYDQVYPYENAPMLDASIPAVYVDFAGNGELRKQLDSHFALNLKHNAIIGGTHWDNLGSTKGLIAKAEFFFAPTQIAQRMRDWGRAEYDRRYTEAWMAFLESAVDWVDVQKVLGSDNMKEIYLKMLRNEADPQAGYMLHFA